MLPRLQAEEALSDLAVLVASGAKLEHRRRFINRLEAVAHPRRRVPPKKKLSKEVHAVRLAMMGVKFVEIENDG